MKRKTPFFFSLIFSLGLALFGAQALAQSMPSSPGGPGGPFGGPFQPPGPPPDVGPPDDPGPPDDVGPPPHAGGDDDDDDDDNGNNGNGVPDFCSAPGVGEGPNGQAGLSSIAHLNFIQIDSETDEVVEDGAWGRMMYRWTAPLFDFVFNGKQLEPGDVYTLTYQPEPLPSPGVLCLGTGMVNEDGDLHIQDAFDIATDLPAAYDEHEEEATLALVIDEHVDCIEGEMLEWTPDDYLFGEEGMFYVHSELEDDDENDEDDPDDDENGED